MAVRESERIMSGLHAPVRRLGDVEIARIVEREGPAF